jgi:photosystem II stability/assembly factor-like uncharacterized protein
MAKRISLLVALFGLMVTSLAAAGPPGYAWQLTPTGSTGSRFRGVSAVSERVAWVSGWEGTEGRVFRTTDQGATWQSVAPPGSTGLQFRDVEAFDADTALIMSIGNTPDAFRIYRTENGGQTWTLVFQNTEPTAFYDCMAFFDRHRGLAVSDPINGRFRIIATNDGGRSWHIVNADMPPALPLEAGFAASGQCLTTAGGRDAWFGTGGDAVARVFHSSDRGLSWTVHNTPIRSSPTGAGISALAFRDPLHGIAAGGEFGSPAASPAALARSDDRGNTWALVPNAPNQLREGADWITGRVAVIVGPTGSEVSFDQGRTWQPLQGGSAFHTVDCARGHVCWAAGEQGAAAYLTRE